MSIAGEVCDQYMLARLEEHVEEHAEVAVADELRQLQKRTVGDDHRAVVQIQIDIRLEQDEDVDRHCTEQQEEQSHQQKGQPPTFPENIDELRSHRVAPSGPKAHHPQPQRQARRCSAAIYSRTRASRCALSPGYDAWVEPPARIYFVLPANPSTPTASGRTP